MNRNYLGFAEIITKLGGMEVIHDTVIIRRCESARQKINTTQCFVLYWPKKTGTCLLKAPNNI